MAHWLVLCYIPWQASRLIAPGYRTTHCPYCVPRLPSLTCGCCPRIAQDESVELFKELQRQARSAPRFESQLQSAMQRVEELEEQMDVLQAENQQLSGMAGTMRSRLDSNAAASLSGVGPSGYLSSYGGYVDDAGMSAVEQQLALAESQRAELQVRQAGGAAVAVVWFGLVCVIPE